MKMSEIFRARAGMYAKLGAFAMQTNALEGMQLMERAAFLNQEALLVDHEEQASTIMFVITIKEKT